MRKVAARALNQLRHILCRRNALRFHVLNDSHCRENVIKLRSQLVKFFFAQHKTGLMSKVSNFVALDWHYRYPRSLKCNRLPSIA